MIEGQKLSAEFRFMSPEDLLKCDIPDIFFSGYQINVTDKSGLVFELDFISRNRRGRPSSLYPRVRMTNIVFGSDREKAERFRILQSAAAKLKEALDLKGKNTLRTRSLKKGDYSLQEAVVDFSGPDEQKPFQTKAETAQFITNVLLPDKFRLTNKYSAFFTGLTLETIEVSNIAGFHWSEAVNLDDFSKINLRKTALNLHDNKGRAFF